MAFRIWLNGLSPPTGLRVGTEGTQGNGLSPSAAGASDGRFVVSASKADNLVPGDSDVCVASVQDPTGNVIMVVGHRERPDEAMTNMAVGSVSVFV